MSGKSGNKKRLFFENAGLLLLSAVLFTLSFPSFVNHDGFPLLAYFALFPAFIVTYRMSWAAAPFYGLFLGLVSYALYNYWLSSFHPLTIFIVPLLYASYYFVLFPVLKLSNVLFPKKSWLLNALIWVSYEYLRTKGFLGYSYGIIGYTQYMFSPVVRLSSVTGVWGVSFLVILPSAFLGWLFRDGFSEFRKNPGKVLAENRRIIASYLLILSAVMIYGQISKIETENLEKWKVALVQQNIDPWQGGYETYRESLTRLVRQSKKAREHSPDIIIWSETSFVPAIEWHTRYRTDQKTYELVKELTDFLAGETIPYITGNDEGVLVRDENMETRRIDYNSTLLFENGEITGVYRKMHLVPFTEHFPYKKQLPWLYELLENSDTHFWEKGDEFVVFETGGIRFSTPICFEDTFGYISREFVLRGADVIVNMTNDSWSGSVAAEVQHMIHAVFRAAENRRSVARGTNGGITCIIDPNGKITERIDPFIEGYLIGDVPIYRGEKTVYTRIGDAPAAVATALSFLILLAGILVRVSTLHVRWKGKGLKGTGGRSK